jgi:hypothetical protein
MADHMQRVHVAAAHQRFGDLHQPVAAGIDEDDVCAEDRSIGIATIW